MIKKIEKTFYNVYGLEKFEEKTITRPCLLTFFPIGSILFPISDSSNNAMINGYFKQLISLLQIRSTTVNSDYTLNDIPFDILSYETYKEKTSEKINKSIPRNNVEKAKKILHNINIISFCAGNVEAAKTIYEIKNHLKKIKYTEEEIKEILKEIFVIQIVDNYSEDEEVKPIPYATTVIIQDVFDDANENHIEDYNSDNPFISTMQINGIRYYLYKSFGENSLYETGEEHKFTKDYINAPIVNAVIALNTIKALSSSINGTPRKEITIYKELKEIIKKCLDYIKNKNIENLTKEEKYDLNTIIHKSIKTSFRENIPVKKLTKEEKEYLNEKDKIINEFGNINGDISLKYESCLNDINEIINIHDNYSFGEIVENKELDNMGITLDVTREEKIISTLDLLAKKIDNLYNIKYPEKMTSNFKKEIDEMLEKILKIIKQKVEDEKFKKIIDELTTRNKELKLK